MELDIKIDNRSLLNKFTRGIGLNALLRLKGIIYIPILISILNKQDVGMISLLQSFAGLFLGISLLNLPDSSSRYLINQGKENIGRIISFIVNSCILLFVAVTIVGCLIFTLIDYKDFTFYFLLIVLLFSKIINKLSIFVFEVFQKTDTIIRNTFLVEYLSLAVLISLYFLNIQLNVKYVILVQVVVVVSVSAFYLKKLFSIYQYRLSFTAPSSHGIIKTGLIMLPVSYGTWIIQNSDFIFVEHYLGAPELATYSFSYSLASLITGLSAAVTFFWYSAVIKMISNETRLKQLVSNVFGLSIFLFAGIVLFYKVTGVWLVTLINRDYLTSCNNLHILIPGFFLGLLIQLFSGIIYALTKEKILLFGWTIGAIVNLLLNLFLLKKYGSELASLSTTISYAIIYVLLLVYTLRKCPFLLTNKFILTNILILILTLSYTIYHFLNY